MKFTVTITNAERVSFEEMKDIPYTKVFQDTDTIKDIIDWANIIKQKAYVGNKKANITDLKFGYLCE